jgi:hypothetical protein
MNWESVVPSGSMLGGTRRSRFDGIALKVFTVFCWDDSYTRVPAVLASLSAANLAQGRRTSEQYSTRAEAMSFDRLKPNPWAQLRESRLAGAK